nr:probable LRR receptor-like serine/threonine-protein kinase At1g53430 [Ipomoea trifida]
MEVNALKEIGDQLGKKDWDFRLNPCDNNSNWMTPDREDMPLYTNALSCNCNFPDGICHVQSIFARPDYIVDPINPLQAHDGALVLQRKGNLMELIDPRLGSDFNKQQAIRMIKVALLCTNLSPVLRPSMSAVVNMLEGHDDILEYNFDLHEFNFEVMRDNYDETMVGSSTSSNKVEFSS